MTIGEFVYNKDFEVCGRIVVYGETDNDRIHEIHKVYDSEYKCFKGRKMPEKIQQITFSAVSSWDDCICINYKTDEPIYDYL